MTQLYELTGFDRRTIKTRLDDAGLVAVPGERRAQLYDTRDALPILYAGGGPLIDYDLTAERARLAHHQANNEALKEQAARGELIPADLVIQFGSAMVAAARAKILAAHTKVRATDLGLSAETVDKIQAIHTEALAELGNDGIPGEIRTSIRAHLQRMDAAAEADN